MPFQSSVSQYADVLGPVGTRWGAGHKPERTYINDRANTAQVASLTITHAATETLTATINGVPITGATGADANAARDTLIAAINASTFVNADVVASSGGAGVVTLTARTAGVPFTVTGSGSGASDLTVAAVTANSTEEPLNPGLAVVGGANDGSCRLPYADAQVIVGVVARAQVGIELEDVSSAYQYEASTPLPVGYSGAYVVEVENSVTPADPVHVRFTAGSGGTQPGAFRTGADSTTAFAVSNARFLTSASAGGKAVVALNLV